MQLPTIILLPKFYALLNHNIYLATYTFCLENIEKMEYNIWVYSMTFQCLINILTYVEN